MIDAMDSYHRRSASICCIPSLDSNNDVVEESASASDISDNDCRYLPPSTKTSSADDGIYAKYKSSSSMAVKAGQHGLHAIASRDVKAGTVIVQCLPLAHSILVPPGSNIMMGIDDDDEDEDEDSGRKKICTRCFIQEGDSNAKKKKFGRCSKCKLVYYCCRSCQVRYILCSYHICYVHTFPTCILSYYFGLNHVILLYYSQKIGTSSTN